MEQTSFFDIQIDGPDEQSRAGAPARGYTVRLGWIQGAPYLIDLGSAGQVLVNGTPVAPYLPVIIQAGDRITIGDTHLTWNPGTEAEQAPLAEQLEGAQAESPKVTVVLPREDDEDPAPEPAPAEAIDATLPAPKRGAQPPTPEPPEDPTLLAPQRGAQPPTTEPPEEATLLAPQRAAQPPMT
ncbi:MAG: FHA domain-containing protein, partial [Anaerolineae bacterium]|nr:FHA domain-containing protein [Anaerolineae bacterium]